LLSNCEPVTRGKGEEEGSASGTGASVMRIDGGERNRRRCGRDGDPRKRRSAPGGTAVGAAETAAAISTRT
jgi:hypothetical protein